MKPLSFLFFQRWIYFTHNKLEINFSNTFLKPLLICNRINLSYIVLSKHRLEIKSTV